MDGVINESDPKDRVTIVQPGANGSDATYSKSV